MDHRSDEDDNRSSDEEEPSCCPLCEMSDLMAALPVKRGLSRHYQGKSKSFASLASVRSVEDLKKPIRKMLKGCSRSCGVKTAAAAAKKKKKASGEVFRPPVAPYRSSESFSGQSCLLLA